MKHAHESYLKLAELLNAKLADPRAAAAAMIPPDADRTTRRKSARQAARSVLPNATETKIFVTANARARVNRTTDGFVKILADAQTDRILGVHMIAAQAGEMIAEAAAIMQRPLQPG